MAPRRTRQDGPANLAFSSGIHYCLGHALARSEAAISLRILAERMPDLARAGTVKRRQATIIRGPVRLPVKHGPDKHGPVKHGPVKHGPVTQPHAPATR